jgi:hypothetical protein
VIKLEEERITGKEGEPSEGSQVTKVVSCREKQKAGPGEGGWSRELFLEGRSYSMCVCFMTSREMKMDTEKRSLDKHRTKCPHNRNDP